MVNLYVHQALPDSSFLSRLKEDEKFYHIFASVFVYAGGPFWMTDEDRLESMDEVIEIRDLSIFPDSTELRLLFNKFWTEIDQLKRDCHGIENRTSGFEVSRESLIEYINACGPSTWPADQYSELYFFSGETLLDPKYKNLTVDHLCIINPDEVKDASRFFLEFDWEKVPEHMTDLTPKIVELQEVYVEAAHRNECVLISSEG